MSDSARLSAAIARLYEDPHLREELTDAPAERALEWASEQLRALDLSAKEDAAFQAGEAAIREQLRAMNSTVGATLNDAGAASTEAQAASSDAMSAAPDEMTLVETLIDQMDAPVAAQTATPIEQSEPSGAKKGGRIGGALGAAPRAKRDQAEQTGSVDPVGSGDPIRDSDGIPDEIYAQMPLSDSNDADPALQSEWPSDPEDSDDTQGRSDDDSME